MDISHRIILHSLDQMILSILTWMTLLLQINLQRDLHHHSCRLPIQVILRNLQTNRLMVFQFLWTMMIWMHHLLYLQQDQRRFAFTLLRMMTFRHLMLLHLRFRQMIQWCRG